jgi:uncharacterized protein YodC (DUF2158 family)
VTNRFGLKELLFQKDASRMLNLLPGDLVRLKSGGPVMVVAMRPTLISGHQVADDAPRDVCLIWFDSNGHMQQSTLGFEYVSNCCVAADQPKDI